MSSSCRCKHQFCYVCGAKWKTCACQQWQEDHLQERLRQEEQQGYRRRQENLELLELRLRRIAREFRRLMRRDPWYVVQDDYLPG